MIFSYVYITVNKHINIFYKRLHISEFVPNTKSTKLRYYCETLNLEFKINKKKYESNTFNLKSFKYNFHSD